MSGTKGESVLAIVGRLTTTDIGALMDIRPASGTAHALVLDVPHHCRDGTQR